MQSPAPSPALHRMASLLMRWHTTAGRLPIHDLLDRIFCEGNVLERYEAAYPDHLRSRVRANLIRFLELALEVDSGRYPSLNHFLARLELLRENQNDAPDEAPATGGQRVRIMTIHASKGLESPVVFLADTGNSETRDRGTFRPLVRWPAEQPRPDCFLLAGRKAERDAVTAGLIEAEKAALQRESVNLLYVAVTRARQILYVSGVPTARATTTESWYGLLRNALDPLASLPPESCAVLEVGHKPIATPPPPSSPPPAAPKMPVALTHSFSVPKEHVEIAPSRAGSGSWSAIQEGDEDGRLRGIAIHRFLQLLVCQGDGERPSPLHTVATELAIPPDDHQLREWLAEARRVVHHEEFIALFAPPESVHSYCELPLLYRNKQGDSVHGIIDRLLVMPEEILLIDYKTHRGANATTIPDLSAGYREQLRLYTEGVQRLWPEKTVRPLLLFTAPLILFEVT